MSTFQSVQIAGVTITGGGVSSAATTVNLNAITYIDGTQFGSTGMAAFGGTKGWATIDTGNTSAQEQISFTSLVLNGDNTVTLSGISHVTDYPPYTETVGFKFSHSGNVPLTFSDNPAYLYNGDIQVLGANNTWSGNNTYSQFPNMPSTTPISTLQPAPKGYVDSQIGAVIAAGAPYASNTIIGISQLSTTPAVTLVGNPTISIASPAVITLAAHSLSIGDTVQFTTSGTLPTGITASTNYYIISGGFTVNTFEIATTPGGTAIITTGTQSGTHTVYNSTPISLGNNDSRIPPVGVNSNAVTQGKVDAMVGTVGTPSSVNKYVTNSDTAQTPFTTTTSGLIPRYNTNGSVTIASTPIATTDAASKSYVDTQVSQFITTVTSGSVNLTISGGVPNSVVVTHSLGKIPRRIILATGLATNQGGSYGETIVNSSTGAVLGAQCHVTGQGNNTGGIGASAASAPFGFVFQAGGAPSPVFGSITAITSTQMTLTIPSTGLYAGSMNIYWTVISGQ